MLLISLKSWYTRLNASSETEIRKLAPLECMVRIAKAQE